MHKTWSPSCLFVVTSVYQATQPRHLAVLLYHEYTNTHTHRRDRDQLGKWTNQPFFSSKLGSKLEWEWRARLIRPTESRKELKKEGRQQQHRRRSIPWGCARREEDHVWRSSVGSILKNLGIVNFDSSKGIDSLTSWEYLNEWNGKPLGIGNYPTLVWRTRTGKSK